MEAKFTKGQRYLSYKNDFDDPDKDLNFLVQKFDASVIPPLVNTGPRGVKVSKKDGIVSKLVPLMPSNRRDFWLNLPTSGTSVDLLSDGQIVCDYNE